MVFGGPLGGNLGAPPLFTGAGLAAPGAFDDALPGVHQPPKFGSAPLRGFGVTDTALRHRHPFLEGKKGGGGNGVRPHLTPNPDPNTPPKPP